MGLVDLDGQHLRLAGELIAFLAQFLNPAFGFREFCLGRLGGLLRRIALRAQGLEFAPQRFELFGGFGGCLGCGLLRRVLEGGDLLSCLLVLFGDCVAGLLRRAKFTPERFKFLTGFCQFRGNLVSAAHPFRKFARERFDPRFGFREFCLGCLGGLLRRIALRAQGLEFAPQCFELFGGFGGCLGGGLLRRVLEGGDLLSCLLVLFGDCVAGLLRRAKFTPERFKFLTGFCQFRGNLVSAAHPFRKFPGKFFDSCFGFRQLGCNRLAGALDFVAFGAQGIDLLPRFLELRGEFVRGLLGRLFSRTLRFNELRHQFFAFLSDCFELFQTRGDFLALGARRFTLFLEGFDLLLGNGKAFGRLGGSRLCGIALLEKRVELGLNLRQLGGECGGVCLESIPLADDFSQLLGSLFCLFLKRLDLRFQFVPLLGQHFDPLFDLRHLFNSVGARPLDYFPLNSKEIDLFASLFKLAGEFARGLFEGGALAAEGLDLRLARLEFLIERSDIGRRARLGELLGKIGFFLLSGLELFNELIVVGGRNLELVGRLGRVQRLGSLSEIARLNDRNPHFTFENAFHGSKTDLIPGGEFGFDNRMAVDESLVGRAEVLQPVTVVNAEELGMISGNRRLLDTDIIARFPADADDVLVQLIGHFALARNAENHAAQHRCA